MRPRIPCLRVAAALLLTSAAVTAQSDTYYPFSFDQDKLAGAPDFSFLNHPLTAADRVFVRDGHFYTVGPDLIPNTDDDRRVRFFGVNLAFGANFPASADAARVARRLRRLGVNLVRLHHMDSSPDPAGSPGNANSILTDGRYPTFNSVSVQRLRDFLTALAAEGIYADLNLHVGYQFRPGVDLLPDVNVPPQSKPVNIFYPVMVMRQQDFAVQLLDLLKLRGDPVLALVEINNESSVLQSWQWGELDSVVVGGYRVALQTQWNAWLKGRYANTESLINSWGSGTPDGPELLSGTWILEQNHGKTGALLNTMVDGVPTAQVQPGAGSGWLFLKQTGFHLTAGLRYSWRFEARADIPAGQTLNVPITVMRDVSPWDGFLWSSVTLTNQWQTFTIGVTPSFDILDSGRVSLDVENSPGSVYVRNMSMVQAGQRGLGVGETLEAGNISLLGPGEGATAQRLADYTSYLISTDRIFVDSMQDAVRSGVGPLVPVTGTQIGYGGIGILDSQQNLSYQDNHFYVDHYSFPHTAWDGLDWQIRDASASDSAWPSFVDMAWARPAGVPYTVSEYNQPWPNTHGAEIDPALAAFAAFQDWDGIMHFAYSHGRNWDDGVPNGFNINGDWTKFPVIGQSAWLFRTGAVASGAEPVSVPISRTERLQAASSAQPPTAWVTGRGIPKETALARRVELVKDGAGSVPKGPFASENGDLVFDRQQGIARLSAPAAAGAFGRLGKAKMAAGAIDIELAGTAASVLLTSLDGRAIPQSRSMLLSLPGYALRALPLAGNRRPDAATAQPQKIVSYPGTTDWWTIDATNSANASKPSGDMNGGWQPTYMQRVEAWITLHTRAAKVTVSVLDGAGNAAGTLPASDVQPVTGGFRIHLNATGRPQSPWFHIETFPAPTVPRGR